MKPIIRFTLSNSEISSLVPYQLLAESENLLSTGKAKRLMMKHHISDSILAKYIKTANRWYLTEGLPQDYEFTPDEISDWGRIRQLLIDLLY